MLHFKNIESKGNLLKGETIKMGTIFLQLMWVTVIPSQQTLL
jgi:hypothetical protein